MSAVDELKKVVGKPGSSFTNKLESTHRRLTVVASRGPEKLHVFYKDDKINIFGNIRFVRRLYARTDDCEFDGVGWIINEDINFCMICARQFGLFLYRHHCRCCGNLVCDSCSPDAAVIFEMKDLGEQRVCVQCFWGQDPVYATIGGHNFDDDEIDDDDDNDDDDHKLDVNLSEIKEESSKMLARSENHESNLTSDLDVEDGNGIIDTTKWRDRSFDQPADDGEENSRRFRTLGVEEAERLREQVRNELFDSTIAFSHMENISFSL